MKTSLSGRLLSASLALTLTLGATGCGGGGGDDPPIPPPVNSPPVANAGSDRNVEIGASVALDGTSSSDPDGDTLSYSWTLDAPGGSSANLDSPSAATPGFTTDMAGEYRASLIVSDGKVSSNPAMVMVMATGSDPVNQGPEISGLAANYFTPALSRLTLEVQTSDPDGDPVTTTWKQISGPSLWDTDPEGNSVEINFPADNGTDQKFRIRVTASDGQSEADMTTEVSVPTSAATIVSSDAEYGEQDDLPPEPSSDVEIDPVSINSLGIYEFSRDEFTIALSGASGAELQGPVLATLFSDKGETDVSGYFILDNQQEKLSVAPAFLPDFNISLGDEYNELVISARDSAGAPFSRTVRFYRGFGRISGQLTSSAGLPYTGLGGEVVKLWGSFKGTTKQAIVQSNGEFEFTDLPADTYNLLLLSEDLKLANTSILISGATPTSNPKPEVVDLGQLQGNSIRAKSSMYDLPTSADAATPDRAAVHEQAVSQLTDQLGRPTINATLYGSLTVVSDAAGVSVNGQETITVPADVSQVKIIATVTSQEFPSFTTTQSMFNDAWQFGHVAGQKVESKQGNVNSSHASAETITFSQLHAVESGDIKIVMFASATNIGDGSVPTTVKVEVFEAAEDDFTVGKFQHTAGLGFGDGRWHIGVGTNSNRMWTGQIEYLPVDSSIQSADCSFVTADGDYPVNAVTVVPAGPGKANVEMGFSGLASVPTEATHGKVACRFEGMNGAGAFVSTDDVVSMEMASGKDDLIPVTRYITGLRFGTRDIGGDHWMRSGTRNYMSGPGLALTYNDASREHGGCFVKDSSYGIYNTAASAACEKAIRDHNSHRSGSSVDVLYPTEFISPANLSALVAQAGSSQTAAAQVATWVNESRNGIDAITAAPEVKKVYISQDIWLYKLLVNGTNVNDQPIAGLSA